MGDGVFFVSRRRNKNDLSPSKKDGVFFVSRRRNKNDLSPNKKDGGNFCNPKVQQKLPRPQTAQKENHYGYKKNQRNR